MPVGVSVAPVGRLLTENTRGRGPSTSVALTPKVISVPSVPVIAAGTVRTGGSFTELMVMETGTALLSRLPSLSLNVKISGPL